MANLFLILIGSVLILMSGSPASAEEWLDGSAEILCLPEKGLFELQTRQTFRPYSKEGIEAVHDRGIFFPEELEAHPFKCPLPRHEIIVTGVNNIDGKGPCGAREGSGVSVTINDTLVAHQFDSTNTYNSIRKLSGGIIELSNCFERQHTLSVRTSPSGTKWIRVELCRIEDNAKASSLDVLAVTGGCKIWSTSHGDQTPFDPPPDAIK